jgi:hypothetical protein
VSPPIHPLASSQGAVFLINSCQRYFSCGLSYERQALFRSYGCFFAEFLGDVSLVRLALLELNTCVGLRYGCSCNKFRKFSWKMALYHLPGRGRAFPLFLEIALKLVSGFFLVHFLKARTSNPIMRDTYSSPSFHHLQKQSRNINRVSIEYGSHHSLRTD